jgi:hypothetical protein
VAKGQCILPERARPMQRALCSVHKVSVFSSIVGCRDVSLRWSVPHLQVRAIFLCPFQISRPLLYVAKHIVHRPVNEKRRSSAPRKHVL